MHQLQFLLRHDPGEHACPRDALSKTGLVEFSEVLACDDVVRGDPSLPGDRDGGRSVIAGNHDDTDTCANAGGDGGWRLRPQGIREAEKSNEMKVKGVLIFGPIRARPLSLSDC